MSWRKYNKRYNNDVSVWYFKVTHKNIKKLRVRNRLKANKRRGTKR